MSRQRPPATPKSSPDLVVVDRISTPDFRSPWPLVVDDFGQPATPENGACRHVIFSLSLTINGGFLGVSVGVPAMPVVVVQNEPRDVVDRAKSALSRI